VRKTLIASCMVMRSWWAGSCGGSGLEALSPAAWSSMALRPPIERAIAFAGSHSHWPGFCRLDSPVVSATGKSRPGESAAALYQREKSQ
jgi:hypothetical protein